MADFLLSPAWAASALLEPSRTVERMIRTEIHGSELEGKRDVGEPVTIVRLDTVRV